MKKVHIKKGTDLLRALTVIQEDATSERDRQASMARRLRGPVNEKEEEDKEEDKGKDKEGEEKPKKEKSKASGDKLPGADRLDDTQLPPGKSPTSKEIAQMINFIRAGASTSNKQVQKDIAAWIIQLREPERMAAYTTLEALALIVLGRKPTAEVPTYEDPAELVIKGGNVSGGEAAPVAKKVAPARGDSVSRTGGAPITVGEGAIRRLREIDVPVSSGRLVPFGSSAHIKDLEARIEDLRRIRSYQEQGSDTRHSLGVAINALKSQLRAAERRNGGGNPRTQAVPPLVEKEK